LARGEKVGLVLAGGGARGAYEAAVLSVLLPALVYVLAVQFIGLYVASALYIALFMIILGKYSRVKSVIVAVCVVVLFFMMFEVWFKVPLFKGMFDPLRFLGY